MTNILKQLGLYATLVLLVACGGGSGGSNTSVSGVTSETPVPPAAPPQTVLSGIAAVGIALDGAVIEVIDASGNLVDIGDMATGTDGSYRVVLPTGVALPVVIRATPPGGTPLLSIVEAPAKGVTELVANINPVTNLVSSSILGTGSSSSEADIAGALATVDPTTVMSAGDAVIKRVFGASVDYAAFATDPNFVANDGTGPGSAADAVLDTLAKRAREAGASLEETLQLYSEAAEPPALLEETEFQVELVSELVKGGTDSAQLESTLTKIGAIDAAPIDGSADVFRTIIQVVPEVIATARTNTASVSGNADLVNVAIDATISVITNTIKKKKDRFGADATAVDSLLRSPGFKATTSAVVNAAIKPVLEAANSSSDAAGLLKTVASVSKSIAEEASEVVSGFSFDNGSTDVSNLVTSFVTTRVTGSQAITADTLKGISDGTVNAADIVSDTGDVSNLQQEIQDFAGQNPDLIDGDVTAVIQEIPKGTWGSSLWGKFNWG